MKNDNTIFLTPSNLVLQVTDRMSICKIKVNNHISQMVEVVVYIPKKDDGTYYSCTLDYFQKSASLKERWITDDTNKRLDLGCIEQLNEVVVTLVLNNVEYFVDIPTLYRKKLLDYFNLNIYHEESSFIGFDCHAFISLISDVKLSYENPEFNFKSKKPIRGDLIVLSNNILLPDSIKHWALCLGDDLYLSKCGESGRGTESLLHVTTLESLKNLYESSYVSVASPKSNAEKWNDYVRK